MDDISKRLDWRFSTGNTNLAACLAALNIPVKPNDPITVTHDPEKRDTVVLYWFDRESAFPFLGGIYKTNEIDGAWSNRESYESQNPSHPLLLMRRALDKRDWLNKAWHARVVPATSLAKSEFKTPDVNLAAVLMALGHPLLRLDQPNFHFGQIPKSILREFEAFQEIGMDGTPAAIMRKALEARGELVKVAKRVKRLYKFTDGICDADGGRIAIVPESASSETIEKAADFLSII